MLKETVICIIIVIIIIFGNNITQNYTNKSVSEMTTSLMALKENITQQEIDNERVRSEMEEIYKQWQEKHEKLAYFIEHDELEKVETELTTIKSRIEIEEYEDSISEVDKSIFILQHIEDKYDFNLQNVF